MSDQARCPSTHEWIVKIWYMHRMDYYLAVEKSEIMELVGKWMDVESILHKVNQIQKTNKQTPCSPSHVDPSMQCMCACEQV